MSAYPARRGNVDTVITKRETQRKVVVRHLLDFGSVSAREMIFTHGITRTAARIAELRRSGWQITTDRRAQGEMAVYRLVALP